MASPNTFGTRGRAVVDPTQISPLSGGAQPAPEVPEVAEPAPLEPAPSVVRAAPREALRNRFEDFAADIAPPAARPVDRQFDPRLRQMSSLLPAFQPAVQAAEQRAAAADRAEKTARREAASRAKKDANNEFEAKARATGAQTWTDADGVQRQVVDEQGRPKFTQSNWTRAEGAPGFVQRRNEFGAIERKAVPLRHSADLSDPNLYYDYGNGERDVAGHVDDLAGSRDTTVAAAAQRLKAQRDKEIAKAGRAPLLEAERTSEEQLIAARLRINELNAQQQQIGQQIAALPAAEAAETEGGFLGIGAKPTARAQAVRSRREALERQAATLQEEITGLSAKTASGAAGEGELVLAHNRAKMARELFDLQDQTQKYAQASERRAATLKAAGKDPEKDPVYVALKQKEAEFGTNASKAAQAMRASEEERASRSQAAARVQNEQALESAAAAPDTGEQAPNKAAAGARGASGLDPATRRQLEGRVTAARGRQLYELSKERDEADAGTAPTDPRTAMPGMGAVPVSDQARRTMSRTWAQANKEKAAQLAEFEKNPAVRDAAIAHAFEEGDEKFAPKVAYVKRAGGGIAINPSLLKPDFHSAGGNAPWRSAVADAAKKGDISEEDAGRITQRLEVRDAALRGAMQDRVMELPAFRRWAASKGLAEVNMLSADAADFNEAWGSPKLRAAADEFMRSEPGVAQKVWNSAMAGGSAFGRIATDSLKFAGTLTNAAANLFREKSQSVEGNPLFEIAQTIGDAQGALDPRLSDRWFTHVAEGLGSTMGFAAPASMVARMTKGLDAAVSRRLVAATIGGLGGATQAQQVIDEGRQAGLSEEDALTLAPLGLAVGATELISPLQRWAGALAGGGRAALLKRFVNDLVREVPEEMGQELVQGMGANAIARTFYDKNRELFEGSEEALTAAGGSAALMTALTAVVGGLRHGRQVQQSRVQLASEQQYRKFLQEGISAVANDPQTAGVVEMVGQPPALRQIEERRAQLEQEIAAEERAPTAEPEALVERRMELVGLERLNNAVLADYANRIAAGQRAEAEIAAMDDYQGTAGPDGTAPTLDPETGRTAARALVRIANGATSGELTAEQRKALSVVEKLELSDDGGSVPMVRSEKGGEVITDRAIDWLRERAPAAADLIRLSETERLRELTAQTQQAAQRKAEAKNPSQNAKTTLPEQPQGQARPALRVAYADQTGTERDAQIPTGARLSTGEVVTLANADRWLAENGIAGARDVRAFGTEIGNKPKADAAAQPAGESVSGRLTGDAVRAAIDRAHANTKGYTPEVRRQHAETLTKRITEAVEAYRPIFGDNVEFRSGKGGDVRGGGFRFEGGKLVVDLGEIAHAKNLPALLKNERRVAKLVQEEAIHSVAVRLFPERKGIEDLWRGVGEKVQQQVRAVYRNDKADDWQMGHEMLRMIVQGRLAVSDGRFAFDGKVSEETASESVLKRIAEFLAKVRDYFQETARRLRTEGADERAASQLEAAAEAVETRLRELVRHGDGEKGAAAEADSRRADVETEDPARRRAMELTGAAEGEVGKVEKVTHKGRSYRTVAVVIDATRANTSHDPAGRVNPDYPADLQPRDRSDAFYRDQQRRIAGNPNLDEEAKQGSPDSGPPIMAEVDGRLVTLIGNGRANAKALMYSSEDFADVAKDYVEKLIPVAEARGISAEAVRSVKNPTLARVIVDELSPDELREISRESNQFAGAETNAVEQADVDADALTPGVLALYDPGFDLMAARNAPFRREFASALFGAKGGNITEADLERRVRLALFAKAYGGSEAGRAAFNRLAGETSDSTRNITGALFDAAPMFAAMKDSIAAGSLRPLDISGEVAEAAQAIGVALRDRPSGQSADAALEGLVGQEEFAMGRESTLSREVVEFLVRNRRSRVAMAEGLRAYVSAVYQAGDPNQAALFEGEPEATRESVWQAARQVADGLSSGDAGSIATELADLIRERTGLPARRAADPDKNFRLVLAYYAAQLGERLEGPKVADGERLADIAKRYGAEKTAQMVREMTAHLDRAREVSSQFAGIIGSIAQQTGAQVKVGKVKGLARAVEKMLEKRLTKPGVQAADIKDALRATLVVRSVGEARQIAGAIRRRIGWEELDDKFETPTRLGYRDIQGAIRLPNGVRAEIQINVPEMIDAKKVGHRYFEQVRSAAAGGPEVVRAELIQRELYDAAVEANIYANANEAERAEMTRLGGDTIARQSKVAKMAKRQLRGLQAARHQTSGVAVEVAKARMVSGEGVNRAPGLPSAQNSASMVPSTRSIKASPSQTINIPLGRSGIGGSSFITDDNTATGADRQRAIGGNLRSSAGAEQGDLFDMLGVAPQARALVEKLPAKAKKSRATFRNEVAKASPALATSDALLGDLFALAQDGPLTVPSQPGNVTQTPATDEQPIRVPRVPRKRGARATGPVGEELELGGGLSAEGVSSDRGPADRDGQRDGQRSGDAGRDQAGAGTTPVGGDEAGNQGGAATPVGDGAGSGDVRAGDDDVVYRPDQLEPAARNFTIEDGADVAPRGNAAKYAANLEAIRLSRKIAQEGRMATPEEKAVLVRYTGWGWAGEYFSDNNPRYAKQQAELKDLLSDDEWRAARDSTSNAHYTSPKVIRAMWDAARRLGFEGGTVLEPAGGTGHFFGVMPADLMARSRLRGVELDKLSARIFEQLYPQAEVRQQGFQESKIPNNSVDLAISNVPFGNYVVPGGADYPKLLIHDYFFARALDKVRPGGLVMFVTSDGTMQKGDARVRRLLAEKADLVGAIRLPNTAFQENAGTEVTTDIIILRKKDGTAFRGESFVGLETVGEQEVRGRDGTSSIQPIRVNEYFARRPEMALGRHSLEGTMYSAGDYALVAREGDNLEALLADAVGRLPEGVMGRGPAESGERQKGGEAAVGAREGDNIEKDGQLWTVEGGELVRPRWLERWGFGIESERPLTPAEIERRTEVAKEWIKLRDVARALFDGENQATATEQQLAGLRASLNYAYDRYVKRYKTLTRSGRSFEAAGFMQEDPDYYLLQSMEVETKREVNGKPVREWVKGDIFKKRIRTPRVMPERVDTPDEAVSVSLGYLGRVDVPTIARLLGVDERQAKSRVLATGRAFENPASGLIETREKYLSGNVRRKLREAREAAKTDGDRYRGNIQALELAQPTRIGLGNIFFQLGSRWLPGDVLSRFATATFGTPTTVKYVPAANAYSVALQNSQTPENLSTHGTKDLTGEELLRHALNGTEIVVTRTEGSGENRKTYRDDAATDAARQKVEALQAAFQNYVKTTADLIESEVGPIPVQTHMENVYNEVNNAMVAPEYSGDYLALPGLTDVVHRLPHRMSVVARILQEGAAMMAHGVGSGKTFSQIIAAMEMKRLGLAQKPMIVVQKATIGQFAASFRQAYPDARILVADENTFAAANRQRFMGRIATGDFDAVIVTQPQFDLLPSKPEAVDGYYNTLLDELTDVIRSAEKEEGKKGATVKQLNARRKNLEAKLQAIRARRAAREDKMLFFEDLGVDALLIDEAHAYKRLPIVTNMSRIKGIPSGESQRAIGLKVKVDHVQRINNGRNVILATGTPITNTMAEAYVMLKLATPRVLEEYSINNFDEFARTFGQTQTKLEFTWAGTWKRVTRFNKFVNGQELVTMIRSGFDVKMGNKELGLKVPEVDDTRAAVIVDQTPSMERVNEWLLDIAATFEGLEPKDKREASWVPIVTMNAGMAAALDPRLIDPTLPDDPGSKVNRAVENIVRIYNDEKAGLPKKTQLVFADRFKPINTEKLRQFASGGPASVDVEEDGAETEDADSFDESGEFQGGEQAAAAKAEADAYKAGGFNLYHDIKAKLVARGIPAAQVAIIHDFNTDKQRAALFEKLNTGDVRVLIGSTEKMGVGVNVQTLLYAAHHMDPPRMMTPAMLEQRDGRIIRQGNKHAPGKVENVRYGMKRSMDTGIYQMLESKGRFIAQALLGKGVGREFSDPADELTKSMAQMKAELTGDHRVLRMADLQGIVRELEVEREGFINDRSDKARMLAEARAQITREERQVAPREASVKFFREKFPEGGKSELTMKSGGRDYQGRDVVLEALGKGFDKLSNQLADKRAKTDSFDGKVEHSVEAKFEINGTPLTVTAIEVAEGKERPEFRFAVMSPQTGNQLFSANITSARGLLQSFGGFLNDRIAWDPRAEAEASIAGLRKHVAALEVQAKGEWPKQAELDTARTELRAIEKELTGAKDKAPAAAPGTDALSSAAAMDADTIEGERINQQWTEFAPESGTLGIPRSEMPQIESEHRGALTQFLSARGIDHTQEEVLPGSLKPTQREFSPAKVEKARAFRGKNRAILVSADNHVLDGHHQYVAALNDQPTLPYPVIRFNAPIRELMAAVMEFPSVETAGGSSGGSRGDLVSRNLGLATSIAAKYFTPANASDHNDIVQVARMGLIKAAQKFDPSRGSSFASYAGRAIRNELNDYYGRNKRRASQEVASLDQPTGDDEATIGERVAAEPENVAGGLEAEETQRAVLEAINALPERPRAIVRGVMAGKSFDEIGEEVGVSRQAAHQSFKGALVVLKRNLQRQGVTGIDAEDGVILSSEGSDEDAIRELMELIARDIPAEAVEQNRQQAELEAGTSTKTVGRPDLANPAGTEQGRALVNAVDETRKLEAERQQEREWSRAAEQMLAADREGVRRALLEKAADPEQNGNLTAVEVKAAKLLVADMTARAMTSRDPALLREAQILTYAYRETGTEQGRALAARRDEFMRPADRHREFLAALMFHPQPALARQLDRLPTPAAKSRRIAALEQQIADLREGGASDAATRRQIAELTVELGRTKQQRDRVDALVAASNEKMAKIEKLLAKMGVTLGDLFSGDAYLRLKGAAIVDNISEGAGYDATKKRVLKLIQGGWSNAEIAKRTKLSAEQVSAIEADFVAKLERRLDQLGDAALDVSKLDTSALFAGPGGPERTLSAEERARRRAEIIKALGFNRAAERDARTKRANRTPRRPTSARPSTRIPDGAVPPAVPVFPDAAGRTPDDFGNRQLGLGEQAGAQPGATPFPDATGEPRVDGGDRQLALGEDPDAMPPVFDISDPVQVAQLARAIQSVDGNGFDMAYEFWMNSILSGPQTQVANVAGNSANAALDMSLQRAVEAGVNLMLGAVGRGSAEAAQFGEFRYLMRGIAPGLARGLRNGIAAWSSEASLFDNDVLNAQIDLDVGKLEGPRTVIPGRAGRVIRIPGRALMFVDDFFKGTLGTMQAGAEAYRIAKAEGLSGEAMERRITGLVNLPGSPAWVRAAEKARELTFQQDIDHDTVAGTIAHTVTYARNQIPGARYLVPFIRTIFNIFMTGVRKSPLGALNLASRFVQHGLYRVDEGGNVRGRPYDRPEMIKHLAEQVIAFGAAALVVGFGEGDEDDDEKAVLITGSRPYEPNKQGVAALNARTGSTAYTIRVGSSTFSYGRYEPIATVLGVTIDTLKVAKLSGRVEGAELFGAAWRAVAEQVTSKTFAQGLGDALRTLQTPANFTNWASSFAASWVPNILRQPLRNIDPYVREQTVEASAKELPARFVQQVGKKAVPVAGVAEPKIDIWGQPVAKIGNAASRLVVPGEAGEARQANRVDAMLVRWNQRHPSEAYAPEPPSRRVELRDARGQPKPYFMGDVEYRRFQEQSGKLAAQLLAAVPLNTNNPSKQDIDRVRRAFEAARSQTRRVMFAGKIVQ